MQPDTVSYFHAFQRSEIIITLSRFSFLNGTLFLPAPFALFPPLLASWLEKKEKKKPPFTHPPASSLFYFPLHPPHLHLSLCLCPPLRPSSSSGCKWSSTWTRTRSRSASSCSSSKTKDPVSCLSFGVTFFCMPEINCVVVFFSFCLFLFFCWTCVLTTWVAP